MTEGKKPDEGTQVTTPEPQTPQTPQKPPEDQKNSPSSFIGALIALAVIYGIQSLVREKAHQHIAESAQAQRLKELKEYGQQPKPDMDTMFSFKKDPSKSPTPKKAPTKLDIATFQSPEEGVILEKYDPHSVDKEPKPPVIIIPSVESFLSTNPEMAVAAQKQAFDIITEIIEKYGQINLVVEDWPKELTTAEFIKTFLENDQIPENLKVAARGEFKALKKIFFRDMLEQGLTLSIAIILAHGENTQIAGTSTMKQLGEEDLPRAIVFQRLMEISENPFTTVCPDSESLSLGKALKAVDNPNKKPSDIATECACSFMELMRMMFDETINGKIGKSAEALGKATQEVAKNGKPTVTIQALTQIKPLLDIIKASKIPVMIITPASMKEVSVQFLQKRDKTIQAIKEGMEPLDTEKGKARCKAWEKDNPDEKVDENDFI